MKDPLSETVECNNKATNNDKQKYFILFYCFLDDDINKFNYLFKIIEINKSLGQT
jgi:hypothetical protein